jgi:hypothetical protein
MMKDIIQKHLFLENYSWEILPGFIGNLPVINFPSEERVFSEELVIKIHPIDGIPWIGNFHGVSSDYLTGIISTPQVNILAIIAKGKGYMVDVNDPQKSIIIPILPIVEVRFISEPNIIIFISFTDIICYGSNGFLWKLKVSCDGIRISDISKSNINGFAWDTVKGIEVPFEIIIEKGQLLGGACSIYS